MASQKKGFTGSSDLASLGVPSSSLYYKVEDFSEKSIEELSTKIASEVCGTSDLHLRKLLFLSY